MKITKFLIFIAIALGVVSCEYNTSTIGSSLTNTDVDIIIDSTSFKLGAYSVENKKIQARTLTQLLGEISVPNYGTLKSEFVTQLMPCDVMDTEGVTADGIDSVFLNLSITTGSFTGDSIVPMRLSVYKLTKDLESPIYSDFDPTGYYDKNNILAESTYSANMLGASDSLQNLAYRTVRVKLPNSLGKEFFNKYVQDPDVFSSPDKFKKWFPGLYVKSSYGSGRVMNIADTEITMYYKKTVDNDGNDSTYTTNTSYFSATPEVIVNNSIKLNVAQSVKDKIAKGEVYIQAPVGYDAIINFPIKNIISTYNADIASSKDALGVINALSLEIPVNTLDFGDYDISTPPYLLLLPESEKEEFFAKKKLPDNVTSYYATYSSISKSYSFTGLREYLFDLMNGDEAIKDADETMVLVPVYITFESSTSSYSSASYVIDVTPYVAAPVIASLNIDKAKIKFTYSKKQVN